LRLIVSEHEVSEHELVTGEIVIEELRGVLRKKFGVPAETVKEIESLLRGYHVELTPAELPKLKLSDHNDRVVVGCAFKSEAVILVTGDQELLDLEEKPKGLQILSPREFWNLAAGRAPRNRSES
jgi:predicted nucleic acid-binding protein